MTDNRSALQIRKDVIAMTAQHTPGPWRIVIESADPEWAIIVDTGGGIVANVNSETGPDASSAPATRKMPRDANARLIAAAPELLAALERILRAHDSGNNGAYMGEAVLCKMFATQARAAIAKAQAKGG